MSIKTEVWGKSPEGKDVHKFTMTNAMGASVTVIEWGQSIADILPPEHKVIEIKYIDENTREITQK